MRYTNLDWLRSLAVFGIVGCHLALDSMTSAARIPLVYTDINVGLFAMLAGFLSAESFRTVSADPVAYPLRRMRRILPPYVFWSVVFVCSSITFDFLADRSLNLAFMTVGWWRDVLFRGGASCHLWFLICLLYVQILIVPLLAVLVRAGNRNGIGGVLLALGICGLPICSVPTEGFVEWFLVYPLRLLLFFIIGVGVSLCREKLVLLTGRFWFCLYLAGLAVIHVKTPIPFAAGLVVTFPLFVFALCFELKQGPFADFCKRMGGLAMGVYLIHPLFTVLGREFIRRFGVPHTLSVVLIDWTCAYLLSLLTAIMLSRIPFLRKVIL